MERNNVQALEQAILESAQHEVEGILNEAKAKADSVRRQAEGDARVEQAKVLQVAREEADKRIAQTIAKAQLEAQMLKLQRRERRLEQTFDRVRQQLASVTERPDYKETMRQWIREAAAHLGDEAFTVDADAATHALLTTDFLEMLGRELHVTLSPGATLNARTGIILVAADGHRRYDNTLEARLTREQDGLRSAVYHILAQDQGQPEHDR